MHDSCTQQVLYRPMIKNDITNREKKESFFAGGFFYNVKTQSVLLHLRDDKTPIHPNQWAFFGGMSEDNETPKECFMREIKEEIGIDVETDRIVPLCNYFIKDRGTWRYVFYVQSELPTSTMKLGEGADFRWIPLKDVFAYDLTEKTRQDLETFLRQL